MCKKKIMCQKSCLLCSDNYKQWSSYRSWQKKKNWEHRLEKTTKTTYYYHDDSCLTDQDGIISEKNRYDIISSLYSAPVLSTKNVFVL